MLITICILTFEPHKSTIKPDPVVPSIVEEPVGVILVTLSDSLFAVYIFPDESMVIP